QDAVLKGCNLYYRSPREVHVVLGNEACDLDSMVSALALAFFLAKTSAESKAAFIPVLNIPRSDFPLRTESTFLLREQGIPENSLVFRDEIDLVALHKAGLLSLTLVDHHVLPSRDAVLEEAVVEVLDHRPLERERGPPCKVTAELVGSCATLVTERILQGPAQVLDRKTAALLHGTIVLDCVNMAPEAGKVTPKDDHYASLLESQFPDLSSRNAIFEALQKAKFDVSGLTTDQMLRKDLKALSGKRASIAISAIYVNLPVFLDRHGLEEELHSFCQQEGYDLLVAMTISFNESNEPFRQIAVYSTRTDLREAVCQALERSTDPSLHLSPLESRYSTLRAYHQGTVTASRKKVLPILKGFLKDWDKTKGAEGRRPEADGGAPKDPPKPHRLGDDLVDDDTVLPPTPMNSLVDECPLDRGLPKLSSEALFERFDRLTATRAIPEESSEKK
uniref:DHHA2 domain-containing protein n=1 Tax=Anolis carolinensis TaxID=28377 RepID=A0A803TLT2_ANOCA